MQRAGVAEIWEHLRLPYPPLQGGKGTAPLTQIKPTVSHPLGGELPV